MKQAGFSIAAIFLEGLFSLLARMPLAFALGCGKYLGYLTFWFSTRRHSAYADLKAAFGSRYDETERWQIIRAHYAHLGQMAVEFIQIPKMDRGYAERQLRFHHKERFETIAKKGQGAVLLTAHLGNWELIQIFFGILEKPIRVLAQNPKERRHTQILNQWRESHGSVVAARGMGMRELYRALKNGEFIGLLGDQDAGKQGGVILPFLGRKTTIPTGAFEMARRAGVPVLPVFGICQGKGHHELIFEEAIPCGEGKSQKEDLIPAIKIYLNHLETWISRHPEQWLWASKRWKYGWTKRILILSDGKAGHVKQSQAVADQMRSLQSQYGRPGMEYPTQTLKVTFKSEFHKKLFPWFALCVMPWIQGRLRWLGFFFDGETRKELRAAYADFIISGGSSLISLNLCLARECCAKSVVLMKPSFPFNFFRYDLALIPAHDQGRMPRETFRTFLTPSPQDAGIGQIAAEKIKKDLRAVDHVKFGVFLGGDTRDFKMGLPAVEKTMEALERLAPAAGDYLVTTSRRTPKVIEDYLKGERDRLQGCQMLVIAREDSRPEVVHGIMALADVLIVTEDSISMISEALTAGKKVVVLSFGGVLPPKHRRFQEMLRARSAIMIAHPEDLDLKLGNLGCKIPFENLVGEENRALQRRLEAIL